MQLKAIIFTLLSLFATTTFAGTPTTCPFTAAELKLALGIDLQDGKGAAGVKFMGGETLNCIYKSKTNRHLYLSVSQILMDDPAKIQGWDTQLTGIKENIKNDPDGAIRQTDQDELTRPNVHYVRSGVIVQLRVMGIEKKHRSFNSLQKKLPALRRLP